MDDDGSYVPHPAYCPKTMDVVECNTRLGLNILLLVATLPVFAQMLVPRWPMPRALYPDWYYTMWSVRIQSSFGRAFQLATTMVYGGLLSCGAARDMQGIVGALNAFAVMLAVIGTTRVFIYDFSIYTLLVCLCIKAVHDIYSWDRMKTHRETGSVFWFCVLLNRLVANKYLDTRILILQPDILFPIILVPFEFIPFPCTRFLSFESNGFLDAFGCNSLDHIHPAHLRYHPDDELLFLFRVRTGNRKELLRLIEKAGPTKHVLLNKARTFFGNTALHIAFRRNDMEMVKILLHHGADPNVLNMKDEPAIPTGDLNGHQLHGPLNDSMTFSHAALGSGHEQAPLLSGHDHGGKVI